MLSVAAVAGVLAGVVAALMVLLLARRREAAQAAARPPPLAPEAHSAESVSTQARASSVSARTIEGQHMIPRRAS